jgi:hypothetical protein
VRTTLTLEDDVAAKVKATVVRTGATFKDVVNEALRLGLAVAERPPAHTFAVQPQSLGLRPGLNLDCISALLEELEGPGHK